MRAKFQCDSITQYANFDGIKVEMYPVMDLQGENAEFWKSTPNGKLEVTVTTSKASELFKVGKHYYLDFTLVE
jgi:hypothetical protein